MKKNLGTLDRAIRLLLAVLVAALWAMGVLSGTAALVLGALAVTLLATSALSFCPLYLPLKLSTLREPRQG